MINLKKEIRGCEFCVHIDRVNMKCHPESCDCESEYELDEKDLCSDEHCDFFIRK